jgi:serine O-acetyltransferase
MKIDENFSSGDCSALSAYIATQANSFFPGEAEAPSQDEIAEALKRFFVSAARIRRWAKTGFSPLESEKNAQFLWLLANVVHQRRGAHAHENVMADRLFYLNKSLNGFTCFYNTPLPEIFFVGHSVGAVLGKARYSDYLMVFQGATVGQINGKLPTLGRGVILFPGANISGDCTIGDRVFVSANVAVIDRDVPSDSVVLQGPEGIKIVSAKRDILAEYFIPEENS